MVYKKIGGKVFSLSSLLLAGVFLPGGCDCEDKDKKPAAEQPKPAPAVPPGDGDAPKDGGADKGGAGKARSKGYDEAATGIYNCILGAADLERLGSEPECMTNQQLLNKDSKKLKDDLNSFIKKGFTGKDAKIYPKSIQDFLEGLSKIEITSKFYANAKAINAISTFWLKLHEIYGQAMALFKEGQFGDKMKELQQKLEAHAATTKEFISSKAFSDTENSILLTGERLVRFFSDIDKNTGAEKTDTNRRTGIMGWIAAQPPKFDVYARIVPKGADESFDDSKANYYDNKSLLGVRGAGIKTWDVVSEKNSAKKAKYSKIFFDKGGNNNLSPIPILELNKKVKADNIGLEPLATGDSDVALTGQFPIKLSLMQLVYALFKGDTKNDFLELKASGIETAVEFIGNNNNFQKLVPIANDPSHFANLLYEQITSIKDLEKIFVIPNVTSLLESIKTGAMKADLDSDNALPANFNGNKGKKKSITDAASLDNIGEINSASISCKLIANLMDILGFPFDPNKISAADIQPAFSLAQEIVNPANYTNVTFEKRVAALILSELLAGTAKDDTGVSLLISNVKATGRKLMDEVYRIVIQEANKSVVYRENQQNKPTAVTNTIRLFILKIQERLHIKNKRAHATYKEIEDLISAKSTTKGLSISSVRQAMEDDCLKLKAVLNIQPSAFLALEGETADYNRLLNLPNAIRIGKSEQKTLNDIRSKYKEVNKG